LKLIALVYDGLDDIVAALRNYHVPFVFGWQDVAQRYRRSKIGPFWITISVAVMIGTISFLFGTLFQTSLKDFLPFVAVGMILWTFISTMITEGCTAFIGASGLILQVRLPLFTHIVRFAWRNMIILAHNVVIIPLVFVAMQIMPKPSVFLAIPGFAILLLNLSWISLMLATLSARFRDITQAVQSVMQIAFFVTPIMWMPQTLSARAPQALLEFNPFHHLIAVVRAPLLGHPPEPVSWIVTIGLAIVGWSVTLVLHGRFRRRVPYWL
jgi:ABC-type polysaccharide/polyol phosphate export permease